MNNIQSVGGNKAGSLEFFTLAASLVMLVVQPFLPALELYIPARVGGFSLFITVIPTLILFFCFAVTVHKSQKYVVPIGLLFIGVIIVILFRDILGIQQSRGLLKDINTLRYIFLVPINFAVWIYLLRRVEARDWLRRCLYAVLLVLGLLGFLYAMDFARIGTIILDPENGEQILMSDVERMRYGGFQTSNSFGCLLVTLMCYIAFADNWNRPNLKLVALALGLIGIIATLSRGPLILGITLFVYFTLKQGRSIVKALLVLALIVGGVALLKQGAISELLATSTSRMEETLSEGSGRENKVKYGFSIIVASPQNFVFGISDALTSFGATEADAISDNSVILAATSGGVPLMLAAVICTWFIIFSGTRFRRLETGFIASVVLGLIICNLYNAVLWNYWLPFVSAVIVILYFPVSSPEIARPTSRGIQRRRRVLPIAPSSSRSGNI